MAGALGPHAQPQSPQYNPFSWLPQSRPSGGPRRRWRDVIRKDLKDAGISENRWYKIAATSRAEWRRICRQLSEVTEHQSNQTHDQPTDLVQCPTCLRSFRRISDMKRHKCLEERRKPINEQQGAVQCSICERWFASKGGLAVHIRRIHPSSL